MYNKDNKLYVEWNDIENYVNKLSIQVFKDLNKCPSGVYGVPRGGLIIATLISYKLDIPLLLAPTKDCLIVDDIADSGRTLLHYTENDTQFNKYYISTMFYHKRSMVKPNYYVFEKTDEWIVYPWEESGKND